MKKNALLLSSSGYKDTGYLVHNRPWIEEFLNELNLLEEEAIFIPYAGVRLSFDEYEKKVQDKLDSIKIKSIHHFDDKKSAIKNAKIIIVGGGNTFMLLAQLYKLNLVEDIKQRVENGELTYIGWSAGANIGGNTIMTTNDMPIIMPLSFDALNIFPHQINPHFISGKISGHNGESREERLEEFLIVNQKSEIYALFEGTGLKIKGETAKVIGFSDALKFEYNKSEQVIKKDIEFKY